MSIGVRVIVNGAWGFAASARVDGKEAERVANLACDIAKANASAVKRPVTLAPEPPHVDVWQTPLEKDPFPKIPIEDKADLLLALTAAARTVKGVQYANGWYAAFGVPTVRCCTPFTVRAAAVSASRRSALSSIRILNGSFSSRLDITFIDARVTSSNRRWLARCLGSVARPPAVDTRAWRVAPLT